jgi:hypothetical protein
MVKTPKTRHYKPQRAPVTIDLEASASDEQPAGSQAADAVSALEKAESPAIAGGFEPWLGPDQAAPGELKAEDAETAGSDASSPRSEEAEAAPADAGDVRPSTPAYGRAIDNGEGETARPRGTAAPSPPQRSGLSTLAAGLIGGVVALAAAGALQFAGVLGTPGGEAATPDISGVQAEIGSLKTELAALKSSGGNDVSAAVAGLTSTVDQVKADLAALQSAVQSGAGGDGAAVGALDAKLKELEAAVTSLSQSAAAARRRRLRR